MTKVSDLKVGDIVTITLTAKVREKVYPGYTSLRFDGSATSLNMNDLILKDPSAILVITKRPVAAGDVYDRAGREFTIVAVNGDNCWWTTPGTLLGATCPTDVFLANNYKLVDK